MAFSWPWTTIRDELGTTRLALEEVLGTFEYIENITREHQEIRYELEECLGIIESVIERAKDMR